MCISPNQIWVDRGPTYEQIPVPCRKCWRCRATRVSDYVARALAEASVSDWTCTLTLTYRDPDWNAEYQNAHRILTPQHFQDFIRSLRKRGHKIRYLVAGEYGELKGRCHFHVILFGKFTDKMPDRPSWPQQERFHIPEWPHGHVFADWNADDRSMRYVCKYLLKYEGTSQSWFSLSKKPALGHGFFQKKAQECIALGLLPSGFEYLPPGGQKKRPYLMTGASRRDYVIAVVKGWLENNPLDVSRLSEWMQKSLAKYERDAAMKAAELKINLAQFIQTFKAELDRRRPSLRNVLHSVLKDLTGESEREYDAQASWEGFTFGPSASQGDDDDDGTYQPDTIPGRDCPRSAYGIKGYAGDNPHRYHAFGYTAYGGYDATGRRNARCTTSACCG